jgi:hypothetical protein
MVRIFFALTCVLCLAGKAYSQQDSVSPSGQVDSTFAGPLTVSFQRNVESPTISGGYAIGIPHRDGLLQTPDGTPGWYVSIGSESIRTVAGTSLKSLRRNAFEFQTISIPDSPTQIGETPQSSRFGLWSISPTASYGLGYALGDEGIIALTHGGGSVWGRIRAQAATPVDRQRVDDFGSAIRFGEKSTAGINVKVARNIGIDVEGTWELMYPRHLVLQWATSQLIESLGDVAAMAFIRSVLQSSPDLAPVVYFIIRNGVAAGFKALRSRQMTWPFSSDAPASVVGFRAGVTFAF